MDHCRLEFVVAIHNGQTKTYLELSVILKNHYAPKKLVIAERYRFHNCVQKDGESVSTFVANLKRLASTCNFGSYLNEALRDRFVCGLRSSNIKKKLLAEDHNFDDALKIALSIEAADKDIADISQSGINKVGAGANSKGFRQKVLQRSKLPNTSVRNQEKSTPKEPCASCGKQGHHRANCKYRNFICYSCGKAGHIADACRGKKTKLNNVERTVETEGPCHPFSTAMYNLSTNRHRINIPVEINGKIIQMELDTGAGVACIQDDILISGKDDADHLQCRSCTQPFGRVWVTP